MAQASRAREHQSAQRGLIVVMLRELAKLWPRLDPHVLNRTRPGWVRANHAVIDRYARMSVGLAGDYYDEERLFARATGRFTAPFPDPPPLEQVDASLRWATKNLWDPAPGDERRTDPLGRRVPAAKQKTDAVASKFVADAGRAVILGAVAQDRAAIGWARQARPDACAFCRLLATRGAVYGEATAGFQAHDGCSCVAVPLFDGQTWVPDTHVREWVAQYKRAAGMTGGTINNFRKVVEGRA